MLRKIFVLCALMQLAACAQVDARRQARLSFDDPALVSVAWPRLETFKDESDWQSYLKTVAHLKEQRRAQFPNVAPHGLLASNEPECSEDEECLESESLDSISVTGSRVASAPASITNTQSVGVDEGDLVKRIGDYLIVLQDGRVFAIHSKQMRLTDRLDVYRPRDPQTPKRNRWEDDFEGADWYDEMLVYERFILITAYSYDEQATELSIIELDETTGRLTRKQVYLMPSFDYYSASNYAARLVGDQLILRTSRDLFVYSSDESEAADSWPKLRQVFPDDQQQSASELLRPSNVFKPVLRTLEPYLHQITTCDLSAMPEGGKPQCVAKAFVGPSATELYVSPAHIYLWNTAGDEHESSCEELGIDLDQRANANQVPLSAIYRMTLADDSVSVASARGWLPDQFFVDEYQSRLRALVAWSHGGCWEEGEHRQQWSFVSLDAKQFGVEWHHPQNTSFVATPGTPYGTPKARFVDEWLVYGSSYTDDEVAVSTQQTRIVTLHERRSDRAQELSIGHSAIRMERLGQDALVNGYAPNAKGLHVSVVGLKRQARVQDSLLLPNRFESEGRSHAFNYTFEGDDIVMGLPTIQRDIDAHQHYWYSDESDLSYLRFAKNRLTSLGVLAVTPKQESAEPSDYTCEVSCIDWYGNARPIFTPDGWFGLMGTELVELDHNSDTLQSLRRLDLLKPVANTAGAPSERELAK